MTKNKFFLLALAIVAMLCCTTSCSDMTEADDSLISKPMHEVTLTFDLGLNARLSTRAFAQRPLESSDNWQRVNSVRVYAFRSDTEAGTYTYYKPLEGGVEQNYIYVSAFSGKDAVYTQEPFEEHEYLSATLTFADGWYKFVAIGREDINGDDNTGSQWNFTALTAGVTTMDALTAGTTSGSAACTELFIGQTDGVEVTTAKPIHETITLFRVVAGVLMYVENIPSEISSTPVATVGIVRRKHTSGLTLLSPVANGSETVWAAEGSDLVGQTPAATDYIVKSENLTSSSVSNGYYVSTSPLNSAHPNSVRHGAFVTPQAAPSADNTLELVLCDASGVVLQARHIKLVASNGATVTPTLLYPLVANNIYCIGQYNETEGTDDPIDLGDVPTDVILVHGSWQADVNIEM